MASFHVRNERNPSFSGSVGTDAGSIHPEGTFMASRQESFIALYASAQPVLQRFICAHVPDLTAAEDVMQETAILRSYQ